MLIEGDARDGLLVAELLRKGWVDGLVVVTVDRLRDAAAELRQQSVGCVLLDVHREEPTVDALHQLRTAGLDAPIVVLSDEGDEELALHALRAGAEDYLVKRDLSPSVLRRSIRHAIERKRKEANLAHLALHDTLTGLPNRALFLDRLAVALDRLRRTSGQVSVLFLDVDNFKQINDTLGHAAGDRVLAVLADRLRKLLRPTDTVARFGGDEFTFLFADLETEHEVQLVADRISRIASLPIVLDDGQSEVTVSIGLASVSDPDLAPESVIGDADAAMYRAKSERRAAAAGSPQAPAGHDVAPARDRPHPYGGGVGSSEGAATPPAAETAQAPGAGLRARAAGRTGSASAAQPAVPAGPAGSGVDPHDDLEGALQAALQRAEMRVYYQPKVSLHDRSGVLGLEALVRWEHPEWGLIAPAEFMSVAERSGLIIPIGRQVIADALHELEQWRRIRPDVTMSVNLSSAQLHDRELSASLAGALQSARVDPGAVCLEVPERVLDCDNGSTEHVIDELKRIGVHVAIDDYGTAASSVARLQRLSVDTLKIDESIVSEISRSAERSAMVGAVVDLGHSLGMRVVAEGVETESQMAELQSLGCDEAQGYFFSRPVPAEQVGAMLAVH